MKRILKYALVPALILFFIGCEPEGPEIDVESQVPVRVEDVKFKKIQEFAYATGTAKAVNEADMTTLQQGAYVLQKNPRTGEYFAMGDHVEQYDTIIKLINPELENQIGIEAEKLNFEISKREFDKQKSLYDKGGVTLTELTNAERNYINAEYAYENAKIQLLKMNVMAPFDGIIVDLPYNSPMTLVTAGTALGKVMDYSRLYSEVTLPSKELGAVLPDQEVLVTSYASDEDTAYGVVTQVSPVLDPTSRMFKALLEIDNENLSLRPGMFVQANIIVKERDSTLVIPKNVIIERRGSKTVYVVEKSIAVERRLETGLANQEEIEILNGLKENDRLVVEGFETLRNRSRVKITK
ncbi:MAG: efflux RND transporter periplasmic adaptor subunit [candidate division Zixibacteria bacterium]